MANASAASEIVISQLYGGGGGATGTYKYDYVELFNPHPEAVNIGGWSLQYGSATGNFGGISANLYAFPSGTVIQPGQYLLIQCGPTGTAGVELPTPADIVTSKLSMSASSGKLALSHFDSPLGGGETANPVDPSDFRLADLVSYGASNNAEGGVTVNGGVAIDSSKGCVRKVLGCVDTNNNGSDFDVVVAPVPRNANSPRKLCVFEGKNVTFPATAVFPSLPGSSPPPTVFVDIQLTQGLPENLMVYIFDEPVQIATQRPRNGSFLLWDHLPLVDDSSQPVKHLVFHAVVPSDQSTVIDELPINLQFIDDTFGSGKVIGVVNAWSLTNPQNPGHNGPPIVNLSAGLANEQVPTELDYGQRLSLLASAIGNPASFKIERLGIEVTALPRPTPPLNGKQPLVHRSNALPEPAGSSSGVTLPLYQVPVLPPGDYEIRATAVDSVGYATTETRNLKIVRKFGIFGVALPSPTPGPNPGTATDPNCQVRNPDSQCGSKGTPCETRDFSATLTLRNDTTHPSGNLRVRVVAVPVPFFNDSYGPLPSPTPSTEDVLPLSIQPYPYPVAALSASPSAPIQVVVSGLIPAAKKFNSGQGVGYEIYSILEEHTAALLPGDPWIAVDSHKITSGDYPTVTCVEGPGGGVNEPPPDFHGSSSDPLYLEKIEIIDPSPNFVFGLNEAQFYAEATAKSVSGAIVKKAGVTTYSKWQASQFFIDSAPAATPAPSPLPSPSPFRTGGLFSAGRVNADTAVQISANFNLGGTSATATKSITVIENPISSISFTPGHLILQGHGVAARQFKLQLSTDLDFSNDPVTTVSLDGNGLFHYDDSSPGSTHFYRVTYP